MRCQREIGQRHHLAHDPVARREQPVEVEQVLREVRLGDSQNGGVGSCSRPVALEDFLLHHIARHFIVELDEHPLAEPPHLGAVFGQRWK